MLAHLITYFTCRHENTPWKPAPRWFQDEGTCPDCNRHLVKYL